jgi:hydroxymethylglutaryl-CoA lyase
LTARRTMDLPRKVQIIEVGPRDGLQNEKQPVPTATKLEFIHALVNAGVRNIEATSFVHPKAVPQLADAMELARQLPQRPGVIYSALVPNQIGFDRCIQSGIERIAVFTAASESFTRKNINMGIDESLATFAPIVKDAVRRGMTVRGYVSTSFVCPYEGEVPKEKTREVCERLIEMGVDEVAVSDTIGAAAPTDVLETVGFVLQRIPTEKIALHFHDTYGTALANVLAGLQLGVTTFDASAGGLGGCPYAPGASGNLATEDLVYMLERMKIHTGIDLNKLAEASTIIAGALQRSLPSRQWQRIRADCRE